MGIFILLILAIILSVASQKPQQQKMPPKIKKDFTAEKVTHYRQKMITRLRGNETAFENEYYHIKRKHPDFTELEVLTFMNEKWELENRAY